MEATKNTTPTPATAARYFPTALVGGAVLVAALGMGAGWMMRGTSSSAPVATSVAPVPAAVQAPLQAPADAVVPPAPATTLAQAPAAAPERPADEVDHRPPPVRSPTPAPAPAPRAVHRNVAPAPAPVQHAPVAQAQAPAPVCRSCGVVESVQAVRHEGPAQGVGAVAGGVVGGLLGNQVGGGTGRTVATVLGAVGGGYAGHQIEKRVRSETVYEVRVRMDDGTVRRFSQAQPIAAGARVVEEGGQWRVR